MKFAVCSDVHLGNPKKFGGELQAGINGRGRLIAATLEQALSVAEANKCDAFFIAGDLADTTRWSPQWVRRAQELFLAVNPMPVHILVGNHDQESVSFGDNALAPLRAVANVVVHETACRLLPRPITGQLSDTDAYADVWALPFVPGPATDWLPKRLALVQQSAYAAPQATVANRSLLLHLGIRDDKTASFLANAPDAIDVDTLFGLMEEFDIDHVFAGNWHDARSWTRGQRSIVQCGALCPTGWNNPGLEGYGGLYIVDVQRARYGRPKAQVSRVEIGGPRFISRQVTSPADLLEVAQMVEHAWPANRVFLRLDAPPGELYAAATAFVNLGLHSKLLGWEVVPDGSGVREHARRAGQTARSADTLQEAIHGFIAEMPLPDDLLRSDVLAEVTSYLPKRS